MMRVGAFQRLAKPAFLSLLGVALAVAPAMLGMGRVYADPTVVDVTGALQDNQTWTNDNVYVAEDVVVPDGVTLDVAEGTVIKVPGSSTGITVEQGGTLNVNGAVSSAVVFTSVSDDSYGGDTNNDGVSSGEFGDYGTAINAAGGTVSAQYATILNGSAALTSMCSTGNGPVSLVDSSLGNTVLLTNCSMGSVTLERNAFEVPQGYPIGMEYSDANILVLAGSDRNTFVGSDLSATAYLLNSDSVPSGTTWTVDPGGGLQAVIMDNLAVAGTLNVNPGSVIKSAGSYSVDVLSGGAVNVLGNTTDSVVFTSPADDTAGGDSTGDGLMLPGWPDYSAAINAADDTTVSVENAQIRHASAGIMQSGGSLAATEVTFSGVELGLVFWGDAIASLGSVTIADASIGFVSQGSSQVTFRGAFVNISDKAILACEWQQACSVDANDSDWGSADGPYASTGDMACGQVTASTWTYQGIPYIDTENRTIADCEVSFSL
jgi:hypothetical protein